MSALGFWVGIGDAAGADNQKREKQEAADRDKFAEDLKRVAESNEWPEESRMTAAQMRARLFGDKKTKRKDWEKMWAAVREASARPGVPSAELAAARSEVPAMRSLQTKLQTTDGVPAPPQDGLTMGRPSTQFDMLRPSGNETPGRLGFLNLQPTASAEPSVLNVPSMSQAAGMRADQAQGVINRVPVPATLYGPRTSAERNMEAMEMFKQQQAIQKSGALELHRAQREIDAQYTKPQEVWKFDSKRGVLVNEATGEIRVPQGLPEAPDENGTGGPPEQQFIAAALATAEQSGINVQDPSSRMAVLSNARRQWAELGRDPDSDFWRAANFQAQQEFRNYRAQMDNRQAAGVIDTKYQKARELASQSIQYAKMLKRATAEASLGGDLAAIFSTMRMLDPGSVVREQEYRVAQSIGGPFHTFLGKMNQLRGTGILDAKVRAEFDRLADMMIEEAQKDYQRINDHYMAMADAWQVPPTMIPFQGPSTYRPGTTAPAVGGYNTLTLPPGRQAPGVSANGAWMIQQPTPSTPVTAPGSFLSGLVNALQNTGPSRPPRGNKP